MHRHFLALGVGSVLCSTRAAATAAAASEPWVVQFTRIGPASFFMAPGLLRGARDLVAAADVVHGHGFYVGTNWLLGRQARRQGKPLVYHPHGFLEPYILNRSRAKKRLAHWLFEDDNFKAVRLWRALTQLEAHQVRAAGVKGPVEVVPNGVDLEAIDALAASPRVSGSRRRVVFMARLHPKKGIDILLPAWASLSSLRRDWELVIAGPDERGYAKQIQLWIDQWDLADSVTLRGPVTGGEKIALLHSSDVFVLPSHSEGFPVTLLEVAACGRPVVTTRACNFPELITAGGGWECDTEVASLGLALTRALGASDNERDQRGAAGRTLVEQQYAWPVVARSLLDACAAHIAP